MIYGLVMKYQVPLMMTFDEKEAQYLADVLGDSILRAHQVIEMFTFNDGEEEWK